MKKFSKLREEIQQLDELSKQTLRRYVKAASGDVGGKRAAIKLLGDKHKRAKGIIGKDVKKREAFIGMASAKVPNAPNRPKKKSTKGESSSVAIGRTSKPSTMVRARAMSAKSSEDHDNSAKGVVTAAKTAISKTRAVVTTIKNSVRNKKHSVALTSDNLHKPKASNKQIVAKAPRVRVRKPRTPRRVKKIA